MWTQSRLLKLDQTDVGLDASKHNSRRPKQTIFCWGHKRLLPVSELLQVAVKRIEVFSSFYVDF